VSRPPKTPCKNCGHKHVENTYQTGSRGGRATSVAPCVECECNNFAPSLPRCRICGGVRLMGDCEGHC
jgi:hypothetical protein